MNVITLNANHVVVKTHDRRVLFSYDTEIASMHNNGVVTLTKDWNYSRTTSKFRNQFLDETLKETQAKLISGEYKLV
jgi:hypothetical protein